MPQNRNRWKRTEWTRVVSVNRKLPFRSCILCGKQLKRKLYEKKAEKWINGRKFYADRWEYLPRFLIRKFCDIKCRALYQVREKNPNYRGKLPECVDCGKPIAYYAHSDKIAIRCRGCYFKWWPTHKTEKQKENLKQRAFKKGMTPWNKGTKGLQVAWNKSPLDTCQIEGCSRPFLAKNMCSIHYQKAKRKIVYDQPRTRS